MFKNSKLSKVQVMCLIAILSALTFVVTWLIPIPLPGGGYFNFSDTFIFIGSVLISPLGGGLVGAIGAGIADLAAGYGMYMPFTIVIKFLEAIIFGLLFKAFKGKKLSLLAYILAGIFMATCYLIPDAILYEANEMGYWILLVNYAFNLIQGIGNAIIAFIIIMFLKRITAK